MVMISCDPKEVYEHPSRDLPDEFMRQRRFVILVVWVDTAKPCINIDNMVALYTMKREKQPQKGRNVGLKCCESSTHYTWSRPEASLLKKSKSPGTHISQRVRPTW